VECWILSQSCRLGGLIMRRSVSAERIAHLAWMQRRERVGVNVDMVAKWKRGVKNVSPRYRDLLCRLFGLAPD
jgi:hypothetical protein